MIKIQNNKTHIPFMILLLIVVVVRITILVTAQTHVHSDEAVIGLMGKHITEGNSFPLFFYGQPFNGGGAFEAYLAAIAFLIFSPGVIELKAVIVILSIITLIAVYLFTDKYWDRKTAIIASILYAFFPTLVKWNFQVRGGYAENNLIAILIIYFAFEIISKNSEAKWNDYLRLGFVTGFGLWCTELLALIILPVFFFVIISLRKNLKVSNIVVCFFTACIGYAPSIYSNLTTSGKQWRTLIDYMLNFGSSDSASATSLIDTVIRIITFELPRFFSADTVLTYKPDLPLSGGIFYTGFIITLLYIIIRFKENHFQFIANIISNKQPVSIESYKNTFLLIIIFAGLAITFFSSKKVPRYLIGIVPFISISLGVFISNLFNSKQKPFVIFSAVFFSILFTAGAYETVVFSQHNGFESLKMEPSKKLITTTYSGKTTEKVINYLVENNIKYVYATPTFQYPIIFESNEKVIASSRIFEWHYNAYKPYDYIVSLMLGSNPIFVIEKDSPYVQTVIEVIKRITKAEPKITEIEDLLVIAPLHEPVISKK